MRSNIGKADRLIRTALAFVIIFGSLYIGEMWAVAGIVVLLTAIVAWCPMYAVLGRSTTKEDKAIPADTSGQHHPPRGPKRSLK